MKYRNNSGRSDEELCGLELEAVRSVAQFTNSNLLWFMWTRWRKADTMAKEKKKILFSGYIYICLFESVLFESAFNAFLLIKVLYLFYSPSCCWGLEYANCIPCREVRHASKHKQVSWVWLKTASSSEAQVLGSVKHSFDCYYFLIHSDLE